MLRGVSDLTRAVSTAAPRALRAAGMRSFSAVADESHDDFKPKLKMASPDDPAVLKAQVDDVRGRRRLAPLVPPLPAGAMRRVS